MAIQLKESLLNLLFPYDAACPICQRTLVGWERANCDPCEQERMRCRLTCCVSAFAYDGIARQLIHMLKYRHNATLAPLLGLFLCATLLDAPIRRDWDAVVPVPLHPSRLRVRGYNQAQLLAQEIAQCYQVPLRTDVLRRIKASKSQTTRTAAQRRTAMEGVFEANPNAAGLRILLVDDVLTTGATATACAKALLQAGAAQVTLITACRA